MTTHETNEYRCLMGDLLLNPDDEYSRVLTIDEAATEVGKAPATVRDWIRKQYLTPMRIGRRTYTTGRDIRAAELIAHRNTPRPAHPRT